MSRRTWVIEGRHLSGTWCTCAYSSERCQWHIVLEWTLDTLVSHVHSCLILTAISTTLYRRDKNANRITSESTEIRKEHISFTSQERYHKSNASDSGFHYRLLLLDSFRYVQFLPSVIQLQLWTIVLNLIEWDVKYIEVLPSVSQLQLWTIVLNLMEWGVKYIEVLPSVSQLQVGTIVLNLMEWGVRYVEFRWGSAFSQSVVIMNHCIESNRMGREVRR
jgi:hypothetical protein